MRRVIKSIGLCLMARRVVCGISMCQLAKKSGVTKGQISKIERGQNVTVKTLILLCDSLSVEPGELLSRAMKLRKPTP